MGISLSELLILMVIGLILFGPEDLPDVARAAGKIVYEIKKMMSEATKDFKDVVNTPMNVITKTFEESVKPAFEEKSTNSKTQTVTVQESTEPKEELLTYDEVENSSSKPQNEEQDNVDDPLAELPAAMVSYKVEKKGASR
ncbi:Sec-independent protein translocase subunit TatA/TatB [Desulfitobacterium sp.]|uniref:Sec-independent protein translocase subunit TatA/TatB n=1 Tax=Desulfitobacterium sp. TaxID=49981 RepID=UPI002BA13726|nr:twin-arginine translocase TatA/TatE family subunit [Desulfitobacterium sp.]HVJ48108.1 twin-arginine translocase TatA/TatE family subunit [Desulfitobacterium sp.]